MADVPTETPSSPELEAEAVRGSLTGAAATSPAADVAPVEPKTDTLADLLAEYENSSKPVYEKPVAAPPATPEAPQPPANPFAHIEAEFTAWQKQNMLEHQVAGLTAEVDIARNYINQQTFDGVVTAIEKRLQASDLHVPADYVKHALMAAAHNPAIAAAFDNRGVDQRTYVRTMKKLADGIYQAAAKQIDRQATEIRLQLFTR